MLLALAGGHGEPWARRDPPVKPPAAHELESLERWGPEPATPDPIDPARFRESLAYLCAQPPEKVPADEVLAAATDAKVDPFLLGALMREQSRCDPARHVREGWGLLDIQPSLYLRGGPAELPVERSLLTAKALRDPRTNLTVGARLLRMWQDQHAEADGAFGGVPHRSGVAHFLWGDRVLSSGGEDLVMTQRRRLIAKYEQAPDLHHPTPIGIPVVCPLEGIPRVATSGPGEDRDGGARRHRGLDIVASEGEPVRALADGVVIFAGVNMRGAPRKGPVPPSKIGRYRTRRNLGPGGIYLCIRHDVPEGAPKHDVVSCYMHLSSYVVAAQDRVTAGETIGFVGKTGVRVSPPHLHFEVRVDDYAKNPIKYLADVIPPRATKTWHHVIAAKRARVRAERAAQVSKT